MQGWIKLHRELLNKPIWLESTPEQKSILVTLLMMANHKEKEWEWKGQKFKAEPGQFVTSLEKIAFKSGKGVSMQNVRTAIKRFERYNFLTNKSTNKNRLITIVNWEIYQDVENEPNKQSNKQLTSNQQAVNKQLTTNKNVKNDNKKDKNNSRKQVYDDTSIYYQLAVYFFDQIKNNNPEHKQPNFQTWADDIRKIIELDKRTAEQVQYLMRWVQQDEFEMVNVLSPSKLRKRFDSLVMKVKREQPSKVTPITKHKEKQYNYGF
ncbi:hypothetical protein SAMN05216389_12615 [Oceanobacillus limi]|uniref:Uncharacterized protein n=2 Tax=Oceanobacillus limi TaxID=930131 RepID=A0A1I0GZG4_9BACI|nr:hypothetical protein SAMN05216389_12615 [Oceanobacillus limi]